MPTTRLLPDYYPELPEYHGMDQNFAVGKPTTELLPTCHCSLLKYYRMDEIVVLNVCSTGIQWAYYLGYTKVLLDD